MAKIFHSIPFYSAVKQDFNREKDAYFLREKYDSTIIGGSWGVDATLFEVLVALSERLDDLIYDGSGTSYEAWWFKIMIENLGLSFCNDEYFDLDSNCEAYSRWVCKNLISRDYDYDGRGGLFPLMNPHEDQRLQELWFQANRWMVENKI